MRRLLALLAALVCGASLLLVPASAQATRAAPSGSPSVSVTPSTWLRDGSVVRVKATGLVPGRTYGVQQCTSVDPTVGSGCDEVTSVTADRKGKVKLRMALRAYLVYDEEFGDGFPVYCRADQCRVFLTWVDEESGTVEGVGSRTLTFRGSPATVAVDPSEGLADTQVVQVTGTAYGAAGRRVQVRQQLCVDIIQGSSCYSEMPVVTTRVRRDGTFATTYRVQRFVPQGGSDLECTDDSLTGSCVVTASVLRRDGTPDLTYGNVADFGDPSAPLSFAGGPSGS